MQDETQRDTFEGVSGPGAIELGSDGDARGAQGDTLEGALSRTERDVDGALKSAAALASSLKKVRAAAHTGNLRDLPIALKDAERALGTVRDALRQAREGWQFDEERYLADGGYTRELLDAAREADLRIYEQDDRLYCYPMLLRLLPGERALLVDRTRERRLRPSHLVSHLKELQRRPARFKSEEFLNALYGAYEALVPRDGREPRLGTNVRLVDIYELLTLLPGQSKDYSRQEFARDLYLLDRSGVTETRKGLAVSFPASTGTKTPTGTIRVITERGEEKTYYAIAFHRSG